MSAMRESWTDARMDDLNLKVDELGRRMENGFNRVDADLRTLRTETKDEFGAVREGMDKVEGRLVALHRLMLQFCGLALSALIGLVAALIGLAAT